MPQLILLKELRSLEARCWSRLANLVSQLCPSKQVEECRRKVSANTQVALVVPGSIRDETTGRCWKKCIILGKNIGMVALPWWFLLEAPCLLRFYLVSSPWNHGGCKH